jgi:hypothetical protein
MEWNGSRESSSVDIATGYDPTAGVRFPTGARHFLYSTVSRLALVFTQPTTNWLQGVRRPDHEAGHGQERCVYNSTPHTYSWNVA